MMKVPSVLHGNIPHNGGVNSIKREGIDNYNSNDNVVWSNKNAQQTVPISSESDYNKLDNI